MTKVHPNNAADPPALIAPHELAASAHPEHPSDNQVVVLTVWKKSLLFNCDGFTVFDSKGNLVFRVDHYIPRKHKSKPNNTILMDASGSSLLTIRRHKRLTSLMMNKDSWFVYEGETSLNPRFSARKHHNYFLNTSKQLLAHVNAIAEGKQYEIEGSYRERYCTVYDEKRTRVAEIKRKEASSSSSSSTGVPLLLLGADVFRLIIHEPDQMDSTVAMAFVVLLDHMFSSSSSISKPAARPLSLDRKLRSIFTNNQTNSIHSLSIG